MVVTTRVPWPAVELTHMVCCMFQLLALKVRRVVLVPTFLSVVLTVMRASPTTATSITTSLVGGLFDLSSKTTV